MPEETHGVNAVLPFKGHFAERVLVLVGVESFTEMVGMYATVLISDETGCVGLAAKISSLLHSQEKKEGVDVEFINLAMSGGGLSVMLYPHTKCNLTDGNEDEWKITSLMLGKENRALCTKDGFLK